MRMRNVVGCVRYWPWALLWVFGWLALGKGGLEAQSGEAPVDRAAWMQEARWGVMTHYLADWQSRDNDIPMSVAKWNELVDRFDVEGLAEQLKSVGAGYHILTIGQNSGYYLSPNAAYDRFVGIEPSKCSRRDLVLDMSQALRRRGMKLVVYLPSGAPSADRVAREALEWRGGNQPNKEFQKKWEQVIREWSERWGEGVAGWWFDGCYWPNAMYRSKEPPNFESFAAAARAGNASSALAFNPGVVPRLISLTVHEDYIAGEIDDPRTLSIARASQGKVDGKQIHVLTFMGSAWGRGEPRFSADAAVRWSQFVRTRNGAITWDVPVRAQGRIPEAFMDQLVVIGQAIRGPAATGGGGLGGP